MLLIAIRTINTTRTIPIISMGKKKNSKISSNLKQETQFPTCIPELSKTLFILFSLAGHFTANDYTDFLDDFPADNDIHNDDEVDEIINSMEFHELDRVRISKGLQSLAGAVVEAMRHEKADLEIFDEVESLVSNLTSSIASYQKLILKQRQIILDLRGKMIKLSRNRDSSFHPFLKYVLMFLELSRQYIRHLKWEEECLLQEEMMFKDGNIYLSFDSEAGKQTPKRMRRLAVGMANCSMLDHQQWADAKMTMMNHFLRLEGILQGSDNKRRECERKSEIVMERSEIKPLSASSCGVQDILKFTSIQGAINSFSSFPILEQYSNEEANDSQAMGSNPRALFLLVTGKAGSGKTHLCNEVETKLSRKHSGLANESDIIVLHPQIPSQFLAPSVGSFEDSLISLFCYIETIVESKKIILFLDDIDQVIGSFISKDLGSGQSQSQLHHLSLRVKNVFFGIMDRVRQQRHKSKRPCNLLVVCTSRSQIDSDRFDKCYRLKEPNDVERTSIIDICLGLGGRRNSEVSEKLTTVVAATIGKSRGDLAQFCRHAIVSVPISDHDCGSSSARLDIMKRAVQSILPESIRNAPVDGFVEMRVLSARELRRGVQIDLSGNEVLPLVGQNARESWRQLQNIIIAPLCRKTDLDVLLNGPDRDGVATEQRKTTSSGVLLTGAPGTGKSAIAYHCASVAAGLDPAIRLLEVSCTSLIHKEVGGSERSVHKLFEIARSAAPCIVILDGIENIAPVRGNDNTTEGTMDRLLSTLLIEMDGCTSSQSDQSESSRNGIAIIGITHNPPSWIDPALLRPGRLEKCIEMENPSSETRQDIFLKAVQGLDINYSNAGYFDPKDTAQLAQTIAMRTNNKSAADILALCENAKMMALKDRILCMPDLTSVKLDVSYHHFLYKK